jgi:hypothetical protein
VGSEDLAALSRVDGPSGRHRLSAWLAMLTAGMSVIALATAVTTPPRSGPYCRSGCVVTYPYTDAAAFVPRDYLWMYPAVLLTVLVVVLAGVLDEWIPRRRRALSRIGRSFTTMAATVLIFAYALQLSVIQPALLRGETEGLSPWTQYHPYGLFIALENVGYAVLNLGFIGIGAALLAVRSRLQRRAGWVFLVGGAATLAALVAYAVGFRSALDYRFEVAAIGISWLVLIVAPVMLARLFAHVPPPDARPVTSGNTRPGDVDVR